MGLYANGDKRIREAPESITRPTFGGPSARSPSSSLRASLRHGPTGGTLPVESSRRAVERVHRQSRQERPTGRIVVDRGGIAISGWMSNAFVVSPERVAGVNAAGAAAFQRFLLEPRRRLLFELFVTRVSTNRCGVDSAALLARGRHRTLPPIGQLCRREGTVNSISSLPTVIQSLRTTVPADGADIPDHVVRGDRNGIA